MKVAILWTCLLIINAQAHPLAGETSRCPYDDCVGHKFICATNGKDYQYFRNVCYMQRFNWCNRACKYPERVFFKRFTLTLCDFYSFQKSNKSRIPILHRLFKIKINMYFKGSFTYYLCRESREGRKKGEKVSSKLPRMVLSSL